MLNLRSFYMLRTDLSTLNWYLVCFRTFEHSIEFEVTNVMNHCYHIKEKDWLNNGTRILLIDLQHYNGNINLMIVTRMALEIPATGGVVPTTQFRTLQFFSGSLKVFLARNIVILISYFLHSRILNSFLIFFGFSICELMFRKRNIIFMLDSRLLI